MLESSVNVASLLVRMAETHPYTPALHVPAGASHRTLTFAELNALSDALAHGLNSVGISRGTRVALMVPPSVEFFALTFALMKAAAIPVMIDPGMGIKNLGTCLGEAEPEAFIGIAKANLARRILGWAKKTVRTTVNVGRWRFFCTSSTQRLQAFGNTRGPYPMPAVTADDPAAILFTSGSTGIAKGAEYTHGIFANQVKMLKQSYGMEPGEVDLCTFPLFALFGPALGMTCVIPRMNPSRPATIDPYKALAQIREFKVTNMFGSPAVIRRMCELPDGTKLDTLRRVISAGAPARAEVLENFSRLLPANVPVFTPYGATEALPVANISSLEILGETRRLTDAGHGVCVGKPVEGVTVSIIPISDEPIAEWRDDMPVSQGTIGEIVVRGPIVTKRYFHRDEATKLAKILDPQTGEILHRMGDVGYFDTQGRIWFCGRKSHRVVTATSTLFTDQVEPIFNTVPGVFRTALVGIKRNGVTVPMLCVERIKNVTLRWDDTMEWLRSIARQYDHTNDIRVFLEHPEFPVDVRHNSKIFREKLAVWASQQLPS